jgi:signal transduction histidine kinase
MEEEPKILVVDDNPNNLNILSEILDEHGYEIFFALDGESALDRAQLGNPDLILLDVMMPGMDGFETCQKLKKNPETTDIPVIFMTALDSAQDKVEAFELGAVDYITKPVEPLEVLARVKTHLKIQRLQKRLKEQLAQEKEMNELKSRVLSIASHDLRTPLTSIKIVANLILRYEEKLEKEKKVAHLNKIIETTNYMNKMLDDLLVLVKTQSGKYKINKEKTDLFDFGKEIVKEFATLGKDTHEIIFNCPEEMMDVTIDPDLFHHILSNLLSNAIKYSPQGGKIFFDIYKQDENFIIFSVKDQGIGIPEEDLKNLFEAFHRAGNVGEIQGTGLGLSIAQQFVELHNGEIGVESTMNEGTTFQIRIPLTVNG